jgi:FAD/FMN-containing dehydrogenase
VRQVLQKAFRVQGSSLEGVTLFLVQLSSSSIAGLTLGGGVGGLVRKYGLTCDNVLSFDIATADGKPRVASANENEDLFWALRGGGGNFGIVTSFEFRVHPVSTVLGGLVMYPRDRAVEVLQFYRDFTQSAPEELTNRLRCITAHA